MKKLLLALHFFCAMQLANAQQIELLETNWFVDHIVLDGVNYPTPLVNIIGIVDPNIVFEETIAYAVIDPESDSLFSDIIYDPNDQEFTFTEPHITLPGCQQYCDFAGKYFTLLFGDGENVLFTYEIVVTDDGTYFLTITDEAGNYAFYQDSPVLGLDDLSRTKLTIYPNPTRDVLFISSEMAVIDRIAIYNLRGQLVFEKSGDHPQVNVSALNNGLYFMEIISEEGVSVQKFIKN